MYLNWCVDYEISSGHLNILDFRIHHLETLLLSNNGLLKQKKIPPLDKSPDKSSGNKNSGNLLFPGTELLV